MSYHTVVVRLSGAPARAVAVEWTRQAAPLDSGSGWEPCVRRADGAWRFSSHDPLGADLPHRAAPGVFGDIAVRYRLSPAGPWSAASSSRKEIEIVAAAEGGGEPGSVLPLLLAAPALLGAAVIGGEVSAAPGLWAGVPAPRLSFQWRRNGADIPGAVARAYAPVAADDLCDLVCAVTARSSAGEAVAVTAAARAAYPAPRVTGELPEEVFDEGTGPQIVAAGEVFAGENLAFAASRGVIDPVTGALALSTVAPVSGETVTVTAVNSGGAASASFRFTVEAAAPALALAAIPAQGVVRGAPRALELSDYATGAGLTYAVSAVPAAPWITLDAATGRLTFAAPRSPALGARVAVTVRVADASGASVTAAFTATAVEAVAPDADRLWRPLHFREPAIFALAADHPDYYARGRYWGEGFQMAHAFERMGDRVVFGGDMCGLRVSPDGGARWFWPEAAGLRGCVFHSIGLDPSDPDVMLVAAGTGTFTIGYASGGVAGIYRTADGGRSFALMRRTGKLVARAAENLSCFCCVGTGTDPQARRWRFIDWSNDTGAAAAKFLRSADGGRSWTDGPALPAELLTAVFHGLTQHPGQPDTLYAYTDKGLWRTTNDGAAWTLLAPGAAGASVADLWIDPGAVSLGATRLICSSGGALHHSVNGGGVWTTVLAAENAVKITTVSVGPEWSEGGQAYRTVYAMNDRQNTANNRKPLLQHWKLSAAPASAKRSPAALAAGQAAPLGQWFQPRVNPPAAGTSEQHWTEICGRGQSKFLPHPTDPGQCAAYGYGLPWRSVNRGADWQTADAGYGGLNVRSFAFSETRPGWMFAAATDVQGVMTQALPDTMEFARVSSAQRTALMSQTGYDDSGIHGAAALILPHHPEVPAAKRGRLLASYGSDKRAQGIYRRDRNAADTGWAADWATVVGEISNVPAFHAAASNPNVIYAGARLSLDAGDSFAPALGGRIAWAVSGQNPAVVFASPDQKAVHRSATYGNADPGVAIKGLAGADWTVWWAGARDKDKIGKLWLHPADDTLAVTHSDAGDLILIQGAATAAVKLQLDLAVEYAARGWTGVLPVALGQGAWCPRDPRRFYIAVRTYGLPMIWRATFGAGFTSVTWENVTRNAPVNAAVRGFGLHPLTGDVYVSGGAGIWMLPAPGPLHAGSVYADLPRPFPQDGSY